MFEDCVSYIQKTIEEAKDYDEKKIPLIRLPWLQFIYINYLKI